MKEEDLKYLILNIEKNVEDVNLKVKILLETFYKRRIACFNPYLNSKNKLIQMTIEGEFPSTKQWNKIAYKEGYYSSASMKYIENCSWKQLEVKIKKEIKEILK